MTAWAKVVRLSVKVTFLALSLVGANSATHGDINHIYHTNMAVVNNKTL